MNKLTRLTALLLAVLMIFSTVATAETAYQVGNMTAEQWQSLVNNAQDQIFYVDEGDSGKQVTPPATEQPVPGAYYPYTDGTTTALVAEGEPVTRQMTASGVAVLQNAEAGQWQIKIDDDWIGITGATGSELAVTAAMMNGLNTAEFRKALEPKDDQTGEYVYFTNTATVEIVAEVAGAGFAMQKRAGEGASVPAAVADDVLTLEEANANSKVSIEIAYWIDNRNIAAARSWTGNSPKNDPLATQVSLPIVPGFVASYIDIKLGSQTVESLDGVTFVAQTQNANDLSIVNGAVTLNIAALAEDLSIVVHYTPGQVQYRVDHYLQNLDNDNYTLIKSTTKTGTTDAVVGENLQLNEYTSGGYVSLLYDTNTVVAADGSTYVEIYYDRLYYLLSFKLGGGQGFDPVYDKFGAPISYDNPPTRAGYEFVGWTLDANNTNTNAEGYDEKKLVTNMPTTVPAENRIYYAVWRPATTTYSVVHWFETLDSTASAPKYYAAHVVTGVAGNTEATVYSNQQTKLVNLANYNEIASGMTEKPIHFEHKPLVEGDKDYAVKLTGDGKSVVNVYYTRKTYTVRFYYAATNNNGNVYVITSQTYNDGAYTFSQKTWANANKTVLPNIQAKYKAYDEAYKTTGYGGNLGSIKPAGSNYTYYYYDVTAKYMDDIAEYWPDFLLDYSNDGDNDNSLYGNRILNSWCMHPGTQQWRDRQGTDANITYKGNYGSMDNGLYADDPKYLNDAYLGTDENGNQIFTYYTAYWRSQSDYWKYHIWLELLPGMEVPIDPETNQPKRTETRTYKVNNVSYTKTFYLEEFVYATSGSGVSSQSAPGYTGYADIEALKYLDGTYRKDSAHDIEDAFELHFYYAREEYPLTYVYPTSGGEQSKIEQVPFGKNMTEYGDFTPPAPDDHSIFVGWYTTAEGIKGTEYDFENEVMPMGGVIVYAKWTPKTYTVTVYDNEDLATTPGAKHRYFFKSVEHGKSTSSAYTFDNEEHFNPDGSFIEPQPPNDHGNWEFVGWFYFDENGEEAAFSFHDTPITRDTVVYAKWRSNALMPYTIRYAIKGENGEDIYIATDTTGSSLAGNTLTFDAKVGAQLNAEYQSGYYPVVGSHSLTLNIDGTPENKLNEYTFYYVKANGIPYKVRYVDKETGAELLTEKVVMNNKDAIVTEEFVAIQGMQPDAFQKKLVLSATGTNPDKNGIFEENVITFYYSASEKGMIVRTHYIESVAGGTYTEYSSSTDYNGEFGQTYTISEISIPGFTVNKEYSETVERGTLVKDKVTYLHLKLYYDRNDYPYMFRFVDIATGREIATSITGTAPYQSTVSQNALEIAGYKKTATTPDSYSMPINIEDPANVASKNVYTFYYEQEQVAIYYEAVPPQGGTVSRTVETIGARTGVPAGSTATPNAPTYKFVGWYLDEACTVPVDASWLDESGTKITPAKAADAVWVNGTTFYAKFVLDVTDLTITKQVEPSDQGAAAPADVFTVTVELPDGEYVYSVNGTESTTKLTVSDGKATLAVKADDVIVIKGILIGSAYKVTETEKPNYYEVSYTNNDGTIAATGNQVVVKNKYQTGSLTISKTVEGVDTDDIPNSAYTFTVQAADGTVIGTYNLKHGESITIDKLPIGQYTVTEGSAVVIEDYTFKTVKVNGAETANATVDVANKANVTTAFTNVYEKKIASLTVEKVVNVATEGTVAPANDMFTIQVTFTAKAGSAYGLPEKYTLNGSQERPLTLENGVATFTVKAGDKIVFPHVVLDTKYQVAETDKPGYYVVSYNGKEGTIAADATAIVTNTYLTGSLKITKLVEGQTAPATDEFTFTLNLSNKVAQYSYTKSNGETGTVAYNGTITLKKDESVTISGIPANTAYSVTETANKDYTMSATGNAGTIVAGETAQATFTNTYNYGDLSVLKIVQIDPGVTPPDDQVFTFEIKLANANNQPLNGTYAYVKTNQKAIRGRGTVEFTNGVAVIDGIEHNDMITIQKLPVGTQYWVEEIDIPAGFSVTYDRDYLNVINPNGAQVTVTNGYPRCSLSITKRVQGTLTDADSKDDVFIFYVQGVNVNYNCYVALKDGQTITLDNLAPGTYNITETNWSHRYTPDQVTKTITLYEAATVTRATGAVVFVNTVKDDKWLHDEASVHNVFTTPTGENQ